MKNIAVIEIPMNSIYKYEFNKFSGYMVLDRPLNQIIPANYGFIPDTVAEDGDPIDVFVISTLPLVPNCMCEFIPIKKFVCLDNGVPDDKIVGILKDESHDPTMQDYFLNRIENYLSTYKPGFIVTGQEDI